MVAVEYDLEVCPECALAIANADGENVGIVSAWELGRLVALAVTLEDDQEPWFSWRGCDICATGLGSLVMPAVGLK